MSSSAQYNYPRALPAIISFLVTNRCVCRCSHCFNWHDTNPAGAIGNSHKIDLTVDEIKEVFLSLGSIDYIYIGGGEPFIRKDFAEILNIIHESAKPKTINISTNGQVVEDIHKTAENFLKQRLRVQLIIKISIDGIGDDHDAIRGLPGAFDRAIATYRALSGLKQGYKNLKVGINTVFSSLNQNKIFDLYEYLYNLKPRPDCMAQLLVRDKPRDPGCKVDLSLEHYKQWTQRYTRDMIKGIFEPELDIKVGTILMYDYLYRMLSDNTRRFRCYAGISGGFIDNEGLVGACEHQEPFGSLKENNYDFKKIWHSPEAEKIREEITGRCVCTNEPQWWHPTIVYNKRIFTHSIMILKHIVSAFMAR
ncbi:MAG: radical SAM protein [Candidatus Omnitrophota bacterium]|nr:radical SAM protein [Candidatus Omnitrophota bacterium]